MFFFFPDVHDGFVSRKKKTYKVVAELVDEDRYRIINSENEELIGETLKIGYGLSIWSDHFKIYKPNPFGKYDFLSEHMNRYSLEELDEMIGIIKKYRKEKSNDSGK